ncbi:Transcriptional regulatory protein ros [Methylobacterium hispanicum]|uniref:Transcriptional regulatory protein ros n=1 Tax=Methylobacterium hispanicum TaxID=270350 RepID=A0AAV4ZX46_9HYPH|nr:MULTISPECIES: MucR family transcriptional regulator [Methylobacterium]GJD92612.1 Transcriptional regulatory protein ros [Methylobacterium hispanicum]
MHTQPETLRFTAQIVAAYVKRNSVPAQQLAEVLASVHRSLRDLTGVQEPNPRKPTPSEIKASVRADAIISFEDGKPYKALRRHLTTRGLTPETYRAKWGLPVDYPLVSSHYSATRSGISRAISINRRERSEAAE